MKNHAEKGEYIDTSNGELIQLVVCKKNNQQLGSGFFMAVLESFKKIASSENLTDFQTRVFIGICSKLDFNNFIYLNISDLAKSLGRSRSKTSLAVKVLCDNGILIKGPKVGHCVTYRLNTKIGYRGSASNKKHVEAEIKRLGWQVISDENKHIEGETPLF